MHSAAPLLSLHFNLTSPTLRWKRGGTSFCPLACYFRRRCQVASEAAGRSPLMASKSQYWSQLRSGANTPLHPTAARSLPPSTSSSAPSGGAPSLPLPAVTVSLQSPHTRAPRLQTRPPHTVGRGGGGPSKIALPACWASAGPAAPARICSCCSAAAESRGLQRRANWLVNRRIALAPSQQKTDGRWTEEGAVVVHFRAFKPQARF